MNATKRFTKPVAKWETFPNVEMLRTSERAIEVMLGGEPTWIPKSVISVASDIKVPGDKGALILAQWFVHKERLIP